jgi:hypothetical protein
MDVELETTFASPVRGSGLIDQELAAVLCRAVAAGDTVAGTETTDSAWSSPAGGTMTRVRSSGVVFCGSTLTCTGSGWEAEPATPTPADSRTAANTPATTSTAARAPTAPMTIRNPRDGVHPPFELVPSLFSRLVGWLLAIAVPSHLLGSSQMN